MDGAIPAFSPLRASQPSSFSGNSSDEATFYGLALRNSLARTGSFQSGRMK